jgi:hypothetical protein
VAQPTTKHLVTALFGGMAAILLLAALGMAAPGPGGGGKGDGDGNGKGKNGDKGDKDDDDDDDDCDKDDNDDDGDDGDDGGDAQNEAVNVQLFPRGKDMAHVVTPEQFTVPDDKVFVLTAVNSYTLHSLTGSFDGSIHIKFNDSTVLIVRSDEDENFIEIPAGISARNGTKVSMELSQHTGSDDPAATLLGYLEDDS